MNVCSALATSVFWASVEELKTSYHNDYIYIYIYLYIYIEIYSG